MSITLYSAHITAIIIPNTAATNGFHRTIFGKRCSHRTSHKSMDSSTMDIALMAKRCFCCLEAIDLPTTLGLLRCIRTSVTNNVIGISHDVTHLASVAAANTTNGFCKSPPINIEAGM